VKKDSINEYLEEMLWFYKLMAKDEGIKIPLLCPASFENLTPWEVAYWTIEHVKQFVEESTNASTRNKAQDVTLAPQSRI
jgi:hypothetical protein